MELEFSRISEKFPNINFLENTTIGNRVVPCGQTDRQTGRQTGAQTDMTTLIVTLCNFMNAPINGVRNSGEGICVNILYVAS
jgi:hypothetical protein